MSSRSTREHDRARSIGCAVLAAGAGVRFGEPGEKLVAGVNGTPLVQHAIDAACGSRATRCSVILGGGAERVLDAVDVRRAAVFCNDDWANGLSSTIRFAAGVHPDDDALVLVLGDAPLVTSADIDGLIEAWLARPSGIVALRAGRVWGAPMVFPHADFGALRGLRGDHGAKGYAGDHLRRVAFVVASSARAFADVDTRADVSRLDARGRRGTARSRARRSRRQR